MTTEMITEEQAMSWMWRSLVRFVSWDKDHDGYWATLPGWNPRVRFIIHNYDIPVDLRITISNRLLEGKPYRCFAECNTGCRDPDDLKFEKWEDGGHQND